MTRKVIDVETRVAAALALRGQGQRMNVSAVCRELGISRETFYVYARRYAAGGLAEVLVDRPRRPHLSPGQTDSGVEERIVAMRKQLVEQGLDAGARSIRFRLRRQGLDPLPAVSTVHRVLRRYGLVTDEPHKRPHASLRRFEYPAPNACWQIDATSWWLADQTEVKIFRVLDDHSRALLASRVAPSENAADAWACVAQAMVGHGPPAMVLTDRGKALNGIPEQASAFRDRLRAVGVAAVSASARHPQTCGKNERSHRPLLLWLRTRPPAPSLAALQLQVDTFDRIYNTERPHQALGGDTPHERYTATAKAGPGGTLDPEPLSCAEALVSARGSVRVRGGYDVQVGREWQGVTVTVLRHDHNVSIFSGDRLVHQLTLDPTRRYQPSGRPRGRGPRRRPRITDRNPTASAPPATAADPPPNRDTRP